MPLVRPGPVRPPFRVLAWVLGPLLIAAGGLMMFLDLRGVRAAGWPTWSRQVHAGLWLGLGNFILGWLVLSAARTGRDPSVDGDAGSPPPE
jgi:hypothetical protein